ncbi:hypothetical protein OF83DRAFT_1170728 [Amylostereum chailletii]|nr:hypothetical protein OF83DRAFT_1170728 [Amylostereum chailletii]
MTSILQPFNPKHLAILSFLAEIWHVCKLDRSGSVSMLLSRSTLHHFSCLSRPYESNSVDLQSAGARLSLGSPFLLVDLSSDAARARTSSFAARVLAATWSWFRSTSTSLSSSNNILDALDDLALAGPSHRVRVVPVQELGTLGCRQRERSASPSLPASLFPPSSYDIVSLFRTP